MLGFLPNSCHCCCLFYFVASLSPLQSVFKSKSQISVILFYPKFSIGSFIFWCANSSSPRLLVFIPQKGVEVLLVSLLPCRERDDTESAELEALPSGIPPSADCAEGAGGHPVLPADVCSRALLLPGCNFSRFVGQLLWWTALKPKPVLHKIRSLGSLSPFDNVMRNMGASSVLGWTPTQQCVHISVLTAQSCVFSWFCAHGFASSVLLVELV